MPERRVSEPLERLRESLTVRAIGVGALAMVMLVPLSAVHDIVRERHGLYRSALADIAGTWGSTQILRGPVLVLPYTEKYTIEETATDRDGEKKTKTRIEYRSQSAVVLPDELAIEVDLREQFRHRGIYDALVYTAAVDIHGQFSRPNLEALSDHLHRVDSRSCSAAAFTRR